jgi:CAAX protease family protein
MKRRRAIVAGLAVAFAAIVWRVAARGRTSAFPAWLGWSLVNPLADRLFGTNATLDRIGLRPGQRVLEIGPGPGRLLVPAARRIEPGGEAVGLDIQPGMIERLRRRADQSGVANLTGVVGDAAALPFPPGSFDVVFLVATLGEITDRETALRQVHRVLAPGGVLSISEGVFDPHRRPFDEVRRLAEDAGFAMAEAHRGRLGYMANFIRV